MNHWIGTKEIAELAECGLHTARKIKKEVNQQIEQKGYRVINSKKAPKIEVMKYIGLIPQEDL